MSNNPGLPFNCKCLHLQLNVVTNYSNELCPIFVTPANFKFPDVLSASSVCMTCLHAWTIRKKRQRVHMPYAFLYTNIYGTYFQCTI